MARFLIPPSIAFALLVAVGFYAGEASAAVLIASDNAANPAYDNDDSNGGNDGNPASNTNGWFNGDNGGFGYGPWNLYTNGFTAGRFIYTSTDNADQSDNSSIGGAANDGDIDTSGRAWGMYANSGDHSYADRVFAAPLLVGQTLSIDMDNGFSDSGSGQSVGLNLFNSTGTSFRLAVEWFGGTPGYSYYTTSGGSLGVAYGDEGLRIAMTLTSLSSMDVTVTRRDGVNQTTSLALAGAGDVGRILLYNRNAGNGATNNAFFNSMEITAPDPAPVPEAGTFIVWTVILLTSGVAVNRRRSR